MNFRNSWFNHLFPRKKGKEELMKKFLIIGLGNIGPKYENTRHNIGFKILDEVASAQKVSFVAEKLGDVATFNFKGKTFVLLKPNTFMNLSGKAVKYWMQQENILIENILVIADDVNIDFGSIRVKAKGSAGGHNGLKDIQEKLNTDNYARFRFGVGANFPKGRQVDFVLGEWSKEETSQLIERLPLAANAILSFAKDGLGNTMNAFNGK